MSSKCFLKNFYYTPYTDGKQSRKRDHPFMYTCIHLCIFKRYLSNCCKWQLRRLSGKQENDCVRFWFFVGNRLLCIRHENIVYFDINFSAVNYRKIRIFITDWSLKYNSHISPKLTRFYLKCLLIYYLYSN